MEYTYQVKSTYLPMKVRIKDDGWAEITIGDTTIDFDPEEVKFLKEILNKQ